MMLKTESRGRVAIQVNLVLLETHKIQGKRKACKYCRHIYIYFFLPVIITIPLLKVGDKIAC